VFNLQAILDAIRMILSLLFLSYASWSDYKTREVSNTVWILFAPPAFALTFVEILLYESAQLIPRLISYGMCFGLTATLAVILFYAGGFGGADAKALMCLAIALPFYPSSTLSPLSGEASPTSQLFFPITIFSNSVILVLVPVFWMISRNVWWRYNTRKRLFQGEQTKESIGKKILVFITGYKMPISNLKKKWHIYPLEDIDENSESGFRRKLMVMPKDEGRNNVVDRLEKAVNTGVIEDHVWASPGLPMMIPMILGLIVALFLGDIVWSFVRLLLM